MSTDPPTTSQVQAYRFVIRRMESALVRRDAVMLHEPMRRHLRATAVGVILGMFGLVAFFVVGKFRPVSELSANEIIVGRPSQEIYVVQDNPRRLIPVRNLTSARLLLAAISPGQQAPEARIVEDSALAGVSRTQSTGIDGVPSLPAPENLIKSVWSVCDTAKLSTTVLIQERAPAGRVLGDEAALLTVEEDTGIIYLVWRGQRERVDLAHDAAVRTYYRLSNMVPRKVSAGLLNAIPEGDPLTLPAIPVQVPSILTMAEAPVTCVTWRGPDRTPAVSIYPDGRLPLGADDNPVELPTAATGQTADSAFLPPGKGALARGAMPGQRPDTGAIWLVTAQGFRYGVPTSEVARALGLGEVTSPAPESILNLLPIGPTLDPRRALELYDPALAQQADR